MKLNLTKSIATALIIVALTPLTAMASTVCYIHFNLPCFAAGPGLPPGRYFVDGDRLANFNAARCVERAREYRAWCQTPGITVSSIFQVSGRNVIGAYTDAEGKTRVTDGVARVTNLHD